MSDPFTRLDQLAARARQAVPSREASVAPAVLRRIRQASAQSDRPLWWFALGSAVAAACAVAINLPMLLPSVDNTTELALYAGWMML